MISIVSEKKIGACHNENVCEDALLEQQVRGPGGLRHQSPHREEVYDIIARDIAFVPPIVDEGISASQSFLADGFKDLLVALRPTLNHEAQLFLRAIEKLFLHDTLCHGTDKCCLAIDIVTGKVTA